MEKILITTKTELAETIKDVFKEIVQENQTKGISVKTLTIHAAAKYLGRADQTVRHYIQRGLLKTVSDGRIPISELENFLATNK